jgi:hypothetical protein
VAQDAGVILEKVQVCVLALTTVVATVESAGIWPPTTCPAISTSTGLSPSERAQTLQDHEA